jgi:hypothetical protein
MDTENPTTDLLNILAKAMDAKVYGSVEVYLEEGQITQISQRIIKKIKRPSHSHQIQVKKINATVKTSKDDIRLKFSN